MPVIQLPRDDRFGLLGNALGGLIGKVADAYGQQQVNQDIAQTLQDPNLSDSGKWSKILKEHGQHGMEALTKYLKAQELQAQLTKQQTLQPFVQPMAAAQLKKEQAGADIAAAQASNAPLKSTTEVGMLQDERAKVQAETDRLKLENQLTKNYMDVYKVTSAEGPAAGRAAFEKRLRAVPGMSEDAIQQGLLSYDITPPTPKNPFAPQEAGVKAAQSVQTGYRQSAIRADQPKDLPVEERKEAASLAAQAQSLEHVMDAIEQGGSTGGPSAAFSTFLAQHGMGTPDPNTLNQLTGGERLLADFVQTGSGFGGEYRVRLGREVLPSVLKGKLFNVMQAGAIAHEALEREQSKLRDFTKGTRTESIQANIDRYQKLIDRTSASLWWTKEGTVFWKGKQVDPDTMQPVKGGASEFDAKQSFDLGGGYNATGAQINIAARAAGMTPQQFLANRQAKYGQSPQDQGQ